MIGDTSRVRSCQQAVVRPPDTSRIIWPMRSEVLFVLLAGSGSAGTGGVAVGQEVVANEDKAGD